MTQSDPNHLDGITLTAFVDGQLDSVQRQRVLAALEQQPRLRAELEQLRRAKDLMKLGFGTAQPHSLADLNKTPSALPSFNRLAACLCMLGAVILAGGMGYGLGKYANPSSPVTAESSTQQRAQRIVLHISRSDPTQFAKLLDYAETFLRRHQLRGDEIAVVANAGGLDMLQTGRSPFVKRIIALQQQYPNLHFIACANSIRALREKGVDPIFIQQVDTQKPAFDQIIERVQQGWRYIKVEDIQI